MHSRSHAFTLVEILVVLAILAVLGAILLAVFGRVRENARRTTCESNLHQIGLAFQQYTSDYNGFYPTHLYSPGLRWYERIHPYLQSSQVFDCPSHWDRYPTSPLPIYGMGAYYAGDYYYNFVGIRNLGKHASDDKKMRPLSPTPFITLL